MRPYLRSFRLAVALILLAAAFAGCMSMVGLGYGHAESVAAWKADQYFDLDGLQKDVFGARFSRLYAWHRFEQLPDYVHFLEDARNRVRNGLAPRDVEWFVEGMRTRYRTLVKRASPDAAELLATLRPEQIENLQRRWRHDNDKFADEHRLRGSLEDRRRARAKRIIGQVRNWTGSLTGEQEARIRALSDALPDIDRLRHEDRVRRQREFVQILELRRGDREKFTARLAHWLANWEEGRNPEYVRLADENWEQRIELYLAIDRMLTPEQRNNVLTRLRSHIGEFARLSRRD